MIYQHRIFWLSKNGVKMECLASKSVFRNLGRFALSTDLTSSIDYHQIHLVHVQPFLPTNCLQLKTIVLENLY